jgi:outer membrane lipoprotein-sorting protein
VKICLYVVFILLLVSCGLDAVASASNNSDTNEIEKTSRPADSNQLLNRSQKLSDDKLEALLGDIEKELGTIKSLKTDFIQEKHLSVFSDVISAKGTCLFKHPDMVRFEINEPFQSVLITKRKEVVKYEFSRGKWQKLKLPSRDLVLMVTGQIAMWLQGRFRDKNSIYDISATAGTPATIILTPRQKDFRRYFSAIELSLAEKQKHIKSVKIVEATGDFTVMKFQNQQRDIELPDEIFDTSAMQPTRIKTPQQKSVVNMANQSK